VYVGGYGPKMKRLTAELADGWVPWVESPETYAKGLKEIRSYAPGKGGTGFDPALMVFTSVDSDGAKAREALRARAKWTLSIRTRLLEDMGYGDLARRSVDVWKARFSADEVALIDALSREIPDDVADGVTLAGTTDEVIDGIERYHDAGVRLLVINPNVDGGEFERTLSAFQRTIIPHFRERGTQGQVPP